MSAPARRVGVLTFHRCYNYGSYWQAHCMVEGLRGMGHRAELLDHHCEIVQRAEVRCLFQPALPERTTRGDLPAYKRKGRAFERSFATLPLSQRFGLHTPGDAGAYDAIVVGSDEVWNFQHPWYGYKSTFFGEGLNTDRLVAYAASFGNHDAAHGIEGWWASRLQRFSAISVRDANSRALVTEALPGEPALVLDPCLQFADAIPRTPADEAAPYLLLYGHGFPDWLVTALARWRARTGVRVISVGYRNAVADEQRLDAGPAEFAALMAGAAGVVTNFFHGCVFALVNDKPFVTAPSPYRFNKVRDLTAALGASDRILSPEAADTRLETLLATPPGAQVGAAIADLRARSQTFLDAALA